MGIAGVVAGSRGETRGKGGLRELKITTRQLLRLRRSAVLQSHNLDPIHVVSV